MSARVLAAAVALAMAAPGAHALDLPDWLAGCWLGQDGSAAAGAIEVWTAPAGDRMLGLGRTVRGSRSGFEFLRIERNAQGVDYVAQPGGRAPTRFAAAGAAAGRIEFSNAAHDFPQRVEYRRDGDALHAELTTMDRSRRTTFAFRRAPCDQLIPTQVPTREPSR